MADEDSDDSEGEGGTGNLNRLIIRPPGHSGKAKRGHLCFDAAFETGNLGKVELISEFEYDLFIRPDTCNPRARQWFNFSVDNTKADQRVIFNIVNISKRKNLFELGMTPIIKSTSRPKWQRIPRKYVYYYKSSDHNGHNVLSICHGFDKEEDIYQFAFSFPFSYSKCQAHIKQMERKKFPFFTRELLASSIQKRKVDIITITNSAKLETNKKRRIIFVIGRINPGDSPASFVCQGKTHINAPVICANMRPKYVDMKTTNEKKFSSNDTVQTFAAFLLEGLSRWLNLDGLGILDFLVSNHPIAVHLRNIVIFKIVPMMNPDGVFLGNHRSNLMGFDLNRNWHQISEWGHPSLYAFDQMVSNIESSKSASIDFILDIHANTTLPGVFVYGNTYDDVYRYERHLVFPKLLAQKTEDFAAENTMYNRDTLKIGTTRRYFCSKLKDTTNCYTLEVSFYGYKKKDGYSYKIYTEEAYQRLGRNVVRTFLDYYQATGILHGDIAQTIEPSKKKERKSKMSPNKNFRK